MTTQEMKHISIPSDVHYELKKAAVLSRTTIAQVVKLALESYLKSSKTKEK